MIQNEGYENANYVSSILFVWMWVFCICCCEDKILIKSKCGVRNKWVSVSEMNDWLKYETQTSAVTQK
jgi:hypothetical protein